MTQIFDELPLLPKRTPNPAEVKRILRAVATIILAAFVEEETVKPSKKASVKKKRQAKAKKPKKKYPVKAKRSTRSPKKKAKRQ